MRHYNTTEARKCLAEIVEKVHYLKVIVSVGRRGEPEVLIIPKPELDEELSISEINSTSPSFKFLEDEPEIYSLKDI